MLIRVVVRIASNAVVCGSAVELWVEQCLPTAIVEAAGKSRIHSPVFAAIRNPPFVGFEACRFKRKFPAIQLLCLAGNHIHDSKKGTRSVQRGTGATNDFHSINQIHIQRELCPQHGLFVNVVVDPMAVDQQEHPAVIRFRTVNASHPGIGKVAVVGDIETAHATQNVSKGAVTVFLDLVSGDYCDRGGSVGDLLYMSRCGVNRDICQLFQAGFAEVLRLLLRKEICRRKRHCRENRQQRDNLCRSRRRSGCSWRLGLASCSITKNPRRSRNGWSKNWGKRTVRPSTAIFPALEQRKNWSKLPLSVLGGLIFWSRTTEYGLRKMLPLRR